MTPPEVTRRAVLGGAAVTGVGVGAGAVAGWTMNAHATRGLGPVRGYFGATQPGVAERTRGFQLVASFSAVASSREQLAEAFVALGVEAQHLADGVPETSVNPKLPPTDTGMMNDETTKGTSVTVSVGASLFDERYGLAARRPRELVTMPFLVNDRLEPAWSHGDVLVGFAADTPDMLAHAIRQLMRRTRDSLVLNWVMDGFNKIDPDEKPGRTRNRNVLGFKDGTANLNGSDPDVTRQFVYVGKDRNNATEPAWTVNGSYHVVRLIRNLVEQWDRATLGEQQTIIGRVKATGAPLGLASETDDPDFASDPDGARIPLTAHIRLARPRTKDTEHQRLLRKGFNYSRGFDTSGLMNQGLAFVSYQRALAAFLAVQERLKGELLEEYARPFGGGFFFLLPGVKDDKDWLGRTLFA